MRADEDEQKGLFTFYKEQELQEEQLRARFNKRKKNKKSKRKIKSQLKSIESSVFVINEEDNEPESDRQAFKQFLKNIGQHSPMASKPVPKGEQQASSTRIKTQPNASASKETNGSTRGMKKTKVLTELSQKYNFLAPKEFSPLSHPAFSPISQLLNACHSRLQGGPLRTESNPTKGFEVETEKSKLLQRLRSLQVKNKSNLISGRDSINMRHSALRERMESDDKKFFNQVASNMQEDDRNGYRLLKDALKLPLIKREAIKTEASPSSQSSSQKRLVFAAKNMPYQRKQLRMRHSNDRRREFYKMNLAAELTESKNAADGPTINFIDMSKDYSREEPSTQEWLIKRKFIKSRLGLDPPN